MTAQAFAAASDRRGVRGSDIVVPTGRFPLNDSRDEVAVEVAQVVQEERVHDLAA